jgi:hypothetical protein
MYDEDSGEEITCPYCDEAEDCPHSLAVIDRTFCECDSGYCADRYEEFGEIVKAAFLDLFKNGTMKDLAWDYPELDELWKYASENYLKCDAYVYLDGYVLDRLVIELLDEAGGERYPGPIANNGGPGCSSALTLYFAEHPAVVFEAAISELRTCLIPKPKKVLSSVPITFAATSQPRAESMTRKATYQEISAQLERLGWKALPPDHPIFSEGPSITFLSRPSSTFFSRRGGQSGEKDARSQPDDSPENGNPSNKG